MIVKSIIKEGGVVNTCTNVRTEFAAGITKIPLRHQCWRQMMNGCNIAGRPGADFMAERRRCQQFHTNVIGRHISKRQAQLRVIGHAESTQTS